MSDKEYKDVDKHYKKAKAKKRWQSLSEMDKLEKEYFKKGKTPPKGKPKGKKKSILSLSGIKAFDKYMAEKWKQSDLKKKIKKKKAEGAAIRAKKRK
jgi:hypothetical protein